MYVWNVCLYETWNVCMYVWNVKCMSEMYVLSMICMYEMYAYIKCVYEMYRVKCMYEMCEMMILGGLVILRMDRRKLFTLSCFWLQLVSAWSRWRLRKSLQCKTVGEVHKGGKEVRLHLKHRQLGSDCWYQYPFWTIEIIVAHFLLLLPTYAARPPRFCPCYCCTCASGLYYFSGLGCRWVFGCSGALLNVRL